MADQGPRFFCLKHPTVEPRAGGAERHRLGPYATREEAEHAVESVAEREQKLTAEDRARGGDRKRTTLRRASWGSWQTSARWRTWSSGCWAAPVRRAAGSPSGSRQSASAS